MVLQLVQSSDMLSSCFNNLFLQLHRHRVNMDALLQVSKCLTAHSACACIMNVIM